MPLNQFVAEATKTLGTDANEIIVDAAKRMRDNAGPGEHTFVNAFKRTCWRSLANVRPWPRNRTANRLPGDAHVAGSAVFGFT